MATAQATVTITVDGTAAAVDDSLPDVTAGTVVNFVFANLVVNDRVNGVPVVIGENATFTLGALTNPASGTLVDNGDGTGTFTPAAGYCGPVSFSYTIENICASDDPCPSADYAISVVCTQVNDFGSGNAAALAAAFPEFEWGGDTELHHGGLGRRAVRVRLGWWRVPDNFGRCPTRRADPDDPCERSDGVLQLLLGLRVSDAPPSLGIRRHGKVNGDGSIQH